MHVVHMEAQICTVQPCQNQMCQFRHLIETIQVETKEEIERSQCSLEQCHLCHVILEPDEIILDHTEIHHVEYFAGMTEAVAEVSSRSNAL